MANAKSKLLLVLLCVLVSVVVVQCLDTFANANRRSYNTFTMRHNDIGSDFRKITKRSHRTKREAVAAGDDICKKQDEHFLNGDKTDFSHNHALKNETKYTMALVWPGDNDGKILMVTTEEFFIFARPSTLYRSEDGGKSFQSINNLIGEAIIRKNNGLQKNPHQNGLAYLVAHTQTAHSQLWITKDSGMHFDSVNLTFMLDGELIFHPMPSHSNWVLTVSESEQALYLTEDWGYTWKLIKDGVFEVRWTTNPSDPEGTIYVKANSPGFLPSSFENVYKESTLEKSTDLGKQWSVLYKRVHSFGQQGRFLYSSFNRESDGKRLMEVSTDGGQVWNEVQLPAITMDRFYAILDMSEGQIFMHVDSPGDSGYGTLYTSDATGIVFSESLSKHLYPNYHDITDFYRVKSMRGVYLASQIQADDSIQTKITFNRGVSWHAVRRPDNVPCKDDSKECALHIHNTYSLSREVKGQPPLSAESAVGIILVHGHIADSLQITDPDVFVSSDGGYHWSLALKGPHYYQIADQGGLLVAVSLLNATPNIVKFSTDEGRCWHEYQFTNKTVIFTGLLTEPGNKAMSVAIWGYTRGDREWQVFTIDFTKVVTRPCADTDYESWTSHFENSEKPQFRGCLLGRREIFTRLKKDSWCYNGHAREVKESRQEVCECSKDDYQCDYGYMRDSVTDRCVKDITYKDKQLDICLRGHVEKIVTEGYHKIPGDQCDGGFTPDGTRHIDLDKKCKAGDKTYMFEEEVTPDTLAHKSGTTHGKKNTAVIVVVVLFVSVILIALAVLVVRKRTSILYRLGNTGLSSPFNYRHFEQSGSLYNVDEEPLPAPFGSYGGTDSHNMTAPPAVHITNGVSSAGAHPGTAHTPADIPVLSAIPPSSPVNVKSYHDDSDEDLLQ